MEAKFITGRESFDNWDAYLAELDKLGLAEMCGIYQAAYDRYAAKPDQL